MAAARLAPLGPADPPRVGRYRLLGRLGVGGMGVVYVAVDRSGRQVALKLIHAVLAADEGFRRRFDREVRRAQEVPPFCTAEVLDFDIAHDPPYLVVEYIDGPNLDEVVRQNGPLGPAHLHSLAIGVATALTAIHGAGVIHRDLKPSNVLLAPGSPKVIDFGIAQTAHPASVLTRSDQLAGTIAYMAPERFDLGPITTATDIFSWGVVIAFAGTGRNPFHAESQSSTAARILTQRPHLGGLPNPLRELVELALAKDPVARPSARELLDLLLAGDPRPARAPLRASRPPASGLRRVGVAAALLLGGAGTALGIQGGDGSAAAPASVSASRVAATPARVPAEPTGGTPVISDPLSRSGQWIYTDIQGDHATCTVTDTLRATRGSRGVLLCIGPEMHISGEHSVAVDTTLESPGSCAAIWFFWTGGRGGYVLRTCAAAVTLAEDRDGDRRVLGGLTPTRPIALHRPLHIEILALDTQADVFLDHKHLGAFPLPPADPKEGGDILGLSVESITDRPPFTVSYANVDIRTYGK